MVAAFASEWVAGFARNPQVGGSPSPGGWECGWERGPGGEGLWAGERLRLRDFDGAEDALDREAVIHGSHLDPEIRDLQMVHGEEIKAPGERILGSAYATKTMEGVERFRHDPDLEQPIR
jgi:hypothetical protein